MEKNILLLFIFLFLFVHILCMIKIYKTESFLDSRIELHDWWGVSDEHNDMFIQKMCSKLIHKYDKINFYSVFGNTEVLKKPRQLNIQITGESYYRDTSLFDMNLIPEPLEKQKNIINFPYAVTFTFVKNIDLQKFTIPRQFVMDKNKFCLFSVTNGTCEQRNQMFKELSKYKLVDSCGAFMNNMSCPGNFGSDEYCEFISHYKFMICFENTSKHNYFTEKLINGFVCGTIPIYWGCPNIEDYVNMDSILYLPPNYTQENMNQLIEKVKYLDEHEDAYKQMYEKCLFKNGILPDCFDIKKLQIEMENSLR